MEELGLDLLERRGQRNPELDAVQALPALTYRHAGALRMHDAAPGRHPVDAPGLNRLMRAQAVAMVELAFEQIGDRGQVDVRVGADVGAVAGLERRGAHVIEEDEGPNEATLDRGQHAPHAQAAEIARARLDDELDAGRRALLTTGGKCFLVTHTNSLCGAATSR